MGEDMGEMARETVTGTVIAWQDWCVARTTARDPPSRLVLTAAHPQLVMEEIPAVMVTVGKEKVIVTRIQTAWRGSHAAWITAAGLHSRPLMTAVISHRL